jgi:uncharacterized protein YgbK (DUF1537 family)
MLDVLVLADDLTGALEAGAKFAAHGLTALVTTRAERNTGGVLVIDTETRHLTPDDAARVIASVPASAHLIYKKTDSTLRGNIAAELRALAAACGDTAVAYIPAYPAVGRTVVGGELRVHGTPVHLTVFANDPLNPIRESAIAKLIGESFRCIIYDGETDADVAAAVSTALSEMRCRVIAGPASVAEELAVRIAGSLAPPDASWPRIERCLIVSGSLHEASSRQIAFGEATGCASPADDAPWRILRSRIRPGAPPLQIADETARAVARELAEGNYDALMVFGGDTGFAILEELGCTLVEPLGEVVTGVPVSRLPGRNLYLVTKAGGFGGDSLICDVKRILDGH